MGVVMLTSRVLKCYNYTKWVKYLKDKPKRELSPEFRAIKRQYASCFVTLFASFCIGLAVSVILDIPIGVALTESSLMAENSMLADYIRNFAVDAIYLISTLITVFVLSCIDGYRKNGFVFKRILFGIILTFVTLLVLNFALGHSVWFSGPTMFFARDVFEARHFDVMGTMGAKKILENYQWIFITIAFWFLYAPLMILGKYVGTKKSKKDFAKVKEEKDKEKVFGEHLP